VWVAKDGRLHIRSLNIVRADRDFAYATSGLDDGDMIVLSALDAVIEGMSVRTQTETSDIFAEESRDQAQAQKVKAD